MPTWGEVRDELVSSPDEDGRLRFDEVREFYLRCVASRTGRAAVLYASPWTVPDIQHSGDLLINRYDVQGFMEVLSNIEERELDVIIHSGGGDPDAAEAIVDYLRSKFDHIRVFVPVSAMSAATMIALSADEIVLGRHSHLGPIDLQVPVSTPNGFVYVPAQAIINEFEEADAEFRVRGHNTAWHPIIAQLRPGLINSCRVSQARAKELVARWLESYMFKGRDDANERAALVADTVADFNKFGSHGRPIDLTQAGNMGLNVQRLEDDDELQDLVLSVFHATDLTFSGTAATKIIENHHGRTWTRGTSPTP